MTLLRRSASAPEARANIESPLVPLTSATLIDWLTGGKGHAGITVTPKSAMGLTAVWRAVSLLSGTIASLPLQAFRIKNDARVPAGDRSQAERLLRDPHPDMTQFEFWELAVLHLCLWGNFYARILRDGTGQITELWPVDPATIRGGRAKDGTKWYRISGDTDLEGRDIPYTDQQIFHIPGMGYDGICGVSPIRAAREGLGLALAAEEFGARLFASGTLASGILQTEQRLTQEQADALKERWKEKSSGLSNAHEAIVLDRGAQFQKMSIDPEDAQFIETRKFQTSEVARLFGIPPHMLMDTEKTTSWGSGIEQQGIGFVQHTLRPWLSRIEQRVTKQLLPAETVYARFRVEGLLRGDSKARAAFYRAMWEIGAYNTNEIRALEEEEPVEGGEVRYRPLNMGKLGTFDTEVTSVPEAEPEPEEEPEEEPAEEPEEEGALT